MSYLWLKAFHVLAVITWMAGAFYIFRLFAYHVRERRDPSARALLGEMERRMLRIVMRPGAVGSIGLGLAMVVAKPELLQARWLQVKLAAVVCFVVFHGYAEYVASRFARDDYPITERQARRLHLVPSVLLLVILVMVVVRPF